MKRKEDDWQTEEMQASLPQVPDDQRDAPVIEATNLITGEIRNYLLDPNNLDTVQPRSTQVVAIVENAQVGFIPVANLDSSKVHPQDLQEATTEQANDFDKAEVAGSDYPNTKKRFKTTKANWSKS